MTSSLTKLCAVLFMVTASSGAWAQEAPLSLSPPKPATASPKAVPAPAVVPPAPKAAAPAAAPAATNQTCPASVTSESREQTIQRVNAYFNGVPSFTSDFTQIGADGRRLEGKLYVQRPGKLRFEYKPPVKLLIVADGTSVVVRNVALATQDLYGIGQTPLKFLLADKIDVARDGKVLNVTRNATVCSVTVTLEDKTTFGGTSRIRLVFNDPDMTLKQWTVTDPQGFDTQVGLANIDTGKKQLSAKLFEIDYQIDPLKR